MGGKEYTSARMLTRNKASWKYGYFEMRAKTPLGLGTWAAIWLLPEKNNYGEWPGSGEIDLLEHVGFAQDSIFGTVHTEAFNHMIGTQKGGGVGKIKPHEDYHLYAIDWTPEKMDFLFDGKIYFTFYKEALANSKQWPFDQPFHVILNLAVGGNLGGKMGVDATAFPARFSIDYVRVYQKKD
jgi:beta-glucanase (GH16 family)